MRQLIAGIIEDHLNANVPEMICRCSTRWLERNEHARFFQYYSRKLLPPLKNELRT